MWKQTVDTKQDREQDRVDVSCGVLTAAAKLVHAQCNHRPERLPCFLLRDRVRESTARVYAGCFDLLQPLFGKRPLRVVGRQFLRANHANESDSQRCELCHAESFSDGLEPAKVASANIS